MKRKGVIISALGRGTFSEGQIERLESVLDATFHAQLTPMPEGEFVRLARPAEILAVTRRAVRDISERVIVSLPKLRGIAIYSTGYAWVDVECLSRHGIALSHLRDYATVTVAEHTLATMLTMSRRIHLSLDRVRGIVPRTTSLRGWELREKTLGIIGFGKIGREVARLAGAFGMRVYFYDVTGPETEGGGYLPLEELLRVSDVIAITASKTRNAPPIVGRSELALIKKGAYVINTSCADLVDNAAVIEAIENRVLAGYAVDDEVDLFTRAASLEPGRVLQTPHSAWYSTEAIARGTEEWVENIVALATGRPGNVAGIKADQ